MARTRLRLLRKEVLGSHGNTRELPPSALSVVTHLSADRLGQLHGLCTALTPPDDGYNRVAITLCAAILVTDRKKAGFARVLRETRAMSMGSQHLVVRLEYYARARPAGIFPTASGSSRRLYPINQLRNKALALSDTDLVLICDVDFRPCRRLVDLTRTMVTDILKRVSSRLNCIVLPAFEVSVSNDGGAMCAASIDRDQEAPELGHAKNEADDSKNFGCSWWAQTLGSKLGLLRRWNMDQTVVPFASQVWEQGHRATHFEQWKEASESYEVDYEEGFEPFVIMNRLLVPAFDERFEGYGRNKVIFFYRLHALGFSFTVEPDLFLVHAPHLPSESWQSTLGCDAGVTAGRGYSERFAAVLDLYNMAKTEIDVKAEERRRSRTARGDAITTLPTKTKALGRWSKEGALKIRDLRSAMQAPTCTGEMRHALWSSMHTLWYEYHLKRVEVVKRLESRQRRGDSDVTIVTQCSCSRLSRLERMCSLWSGVLSVAIIAEGGGRVGRRMRRMASALHERVEGKTKCRLDICLCQPAPGPAARDGLYPVNALRNVALGAAKTDLVLLLDVDAMPMRGLHQIITSHSTYDQLLQECQGGGCAKHKTTGTAGHATTTAAANVAGRPTFLVIPALEFVGACSPQDQRIQSLLDSGDKQTATNLVVGGDLQGFHANSFAPGHAQTNLSRWCSLPAGAATYEVTYAPGYEPYGLFSRLHTPLFDERFRGFGLDKVSYCWHLDRLGWAFRTLPAAFLIDLPHPPTEHKKAYRRTPAYRAGIDGLFERFITEVDSSKELRCVSALASRFTAPSSTASNIAPPPRDYEVLADLSLLAWGDTWVAGARQGGLTGKCGGGWEMKGGSNTWSGLLWKEDCDQQQDINDSTANRKRAVGDTRIANVFVKVPSRMVGGWTSVRIGRWKGAGTALGLLARSVVAADLVHGSLRYWVRPGWNLNKSPRGKLPGIGLSGDVRFFVRWYSGNVGFCTLMKLAHPLQDTCQVHVVLCAPFALERNTATLIQLEVDLRRKADRGGAVLFRAWAAGEVVYEARVYASDECLSGEESRVNEVLFHVLACESDEDESGFPQHVLIGGFEMWGRCASGEETRRSGNAGGIGGLGDAAKEAKRHVSGGDGQEGEEKEEAPDLSGAVHKRHEENLRFVFVASTGRCGTHFLSRLLDTAPDVIAYHEARPTLSGHDTLLAAAHSPEKSYSKRRYKADEIVKSALQSLAKQDRRGRGSRALTYVDTSHLFLKAFSDVVMRELAPNYRVDVIVLRRDPAKVLKSRIDLGQFCRSNKKSGWLVLPDCTAPPRGTDSCAACNCPNREKVSCGHDGRRVHQAADMDGFDALIAYADNTEDRIRNFRNQHERRSTEQKALLLQPPLPPASELPLPRLAAPASCTVVETTLEALSTEGGVRRLFKDLDLDVSERTWGVVRAGATNTRDGDKWREVPLEYCRERLKRSSSPYYRGRK